MSLLCYMVPSSGQLNTLVTSLFLLARRPFSNGLLHLHPICAAVVGGYETLLRIVSTISLSTSVTSPAAVTEL